MAAFYETVSSPLGEILLLSDGTRLTGLQFADRTPQEGRTDESPEERNLPVFDQTKEWLDVFFAGRVPPLIPPLKIDSSPFRKAVYDELLAIPYGQTTSYAQIAARLVRSGKRASCSARGGQCRFTQSDPADRTVPPRDRLGRISHRVRGRRRTKTSFASA